MPPELGLVCVTQSTEVRYKTVTRKRLLALPPQGQRALLDDLYRANIAAFETALRYCAREGIFLYRILSSIFPFATRTSDAKRCNRLRRRWRKPASARLPASAS